MYGKPTVVSTIILSPRDRLKCQLEVQLAFSDISIEAVRNIYNKRELPIERFPSDSLVLRILENPSEYVKDDVEFVRGLLLDTCRDIIKKNIEARENKPVVTASKPTPAPSIPSVEELEEIGNRIRRIAEQEKSYSKGWTAQGTVPYIRTPYIPSDEDVTKSTNERVGTGSGIEWKTALSSLIGSGLLSNTFITQTFMDMDNPKE